MVEGPDFRFGKNREGDVSLLKQLCQNAKISLRVIESVKAKASLVSSTRIRQFIADGDVCQAQTLLGRPYSICGTVVAGAARGRELGFPTANLADVAVQLPADGVYAGVAQIDSIPFAIAVNIGPNPTFDDGQRKVECHVLDFAGGLYGQNLSVGLLQRIRGLSRFENGDELVQQISKDVDAIRQVYAKHQPVD